jgi:glucan 1,3-beta-glucosidase
MRLHLQDSSSNSMARPDVGVAADEKMSKSTHTPKHRSTPITTEAQVVANAKNDNNSAYALDLPSLVEPEFEVLQKSMRATLLAGSHGLCFSPYVDGQGPGTIVTESQIRTRLGIIKPFTRWVRSFSCTQGNELIPRLAHEYGLKTLVGAWLGTDQTINAAEIEGVINVARAGHADIVAVGNEVMLREDLSEDQLIAYIQQVKDALPGVQVGYVDAYYLFEKHPRITAVCDVILTNCYPFWEGCPQEEAIAYMQSMYKRTLSAAAGKKVIISETGWPNKGTAFHGSIPSWVGAVRYFLDTCAWAANQNVDVFYFAAFDEAWKVGAEGDVGPYWGLWDKDGQPKYVSNLTP